MALNLTDVSSAHEQSVKKTAGGHKLADINSVDDCFELMQALTPSLSSYPSPQIQTKLPNLRHVYV
jgi:hypothetical protein